MPTVRFTAPPKLPRDWADKPYRDGWEGEMPQDEAERWVRRGVAMIVTPAMKAAETRAARAASEAQTPAEPLAEPPAEDPAQDGAPEIPEDWRDQHHLARIALARRISGEDIATAADADGIIAAEADRRAASPGDP